VLSIHPARLPGAGLRRRGGPCCDTRPVALFHDQACATLSGLRQGLGETRSPIPAQRHGAPTSYRVLRTQSFYFVMKHVIMFGVKPSLERR
jgi:hypothetical protein